MAAPLNSNENYRRQETSNLCSYPCFSPNTTVVDRRLGGVNLVCGSDIAERGIDAAFAIGTSGEDAQRRAILARAGE